MDFLPRHGFNKCVRRYRSQYCIQTFSCFDQSPCMAFAQLTYRARLRDIETCLRTLQPKLYHAGIQGPVSRSTLADANEKKDCRIHEDFARTLIRIARHLYADLLSLFYLLNMFISCQFLKLHLEFPSNTFRTTEWSNSPNPTW
jgi:hypothetical protein